MSTTRASFAELWIRQRALLGALSSSVIHDLNNLYASIETNAFLLRGPQLGEGAEALEGIEAAVHSAALASRRLWALGVPSLPESSPLRVEHAIKMVMPLLMQLGRDDLTLSVDISPGTEDVLVGGSLFQHGFLTLAVLAAELSPARGGLAIVARRAAQQCRIEISLTVSAVQVPDFLALDGPDVAAGLGIGQLVHWLAQHQGGDLIVETPTEGSLRFSLLLPEAQPETLLPPSAGEV